MTINCVSRLCALLVVFAVTLSSYSAHAVPAEPTNTPLPKSGTLSTSRTSGYGGMAVDGIWGDADTIDKDKAPVAGSVSRGPNNNWIARVFNNSKDPYYVSVSVRQLNEHGSTLKTDSFSATLKGGEKMEQTFAGVIGTSDTSLELVRWKNLKKPEKKTTTEEKTTTQGENTTPRGADGLPLPTTEEE